ncbi:hypothetical protein VNO77_18946 [Canavalia gladiata]|uniref:Uncharacterized protein n=1 Tax=Canavalia gladiata TaxID=3824 RepID=A0AAN9LLR7_CANGL
MMVIDPGDYCHASWRSLVQGFLFTTWNVRTDVADDQIVDQSSKTDVDQKLHGSSLGLIQEYEHMLTKALSSCVCPFQMPPISHVGSV